ncbi:hypothetical protein TRV_02113 [Trichophyton verrucosum HKI 0517]|uniref:Uncharacterized protein n=1 Tax=Trichophyton verrucosum (strain HKI 0517) TaxID=663202 RepID=D4D4U6_TRIVH|nr:uncharacterized protein TRV_02113 [Trichophyton verrucosum HKI 0517]EFE43108.1 hypothetical protein TRV_02113 [Trichophyton verrucosum HKI 0517]
MTTISYRIITRLDDRRRSRWSTTRVEVSEDDVQVLQLTAASVTASATAIWRPYQQPAASNCSFATAKKKKRHRRCRRRSKKKKNKRQKKKGKEKKKRGAESHPVCWYNPSARLACHGTDPGWLKEEEERSPPNLLWLELFVRFSWKADGLVQWQLVSSALALGFSIGPVCLAKGEKGKTGRAQKAKHSKVQSGGGPVQPENDREKKGRKKRERRKGKEGKKGKRTKNKNNDYDYDH